MPDQDEKTSRASHDALYLTALKDPEGRCFTRTLVNEVDQAKAALGAQNAEPQVHWTDAERSLFAEFLAREYPNEASVGVMALGDAWKDGLRVGFEAKAAVGRANRRT